MEREGYECLYIFTGRAEKMGWGFQRRRLRTERVADDCAGVLLSALGFLFFFTWAGLEVLDAAEDPRLLSEERTDGTFSSA